MTPDGIWAKAIESGLDKQIGSTGKTPTATIGARLYVDIRDNGEESKFVQVSKRPPLFMLRGSEVKKADIDKAVEKQENDEKRTTSTFHERDLHPLLVKYVNTNQHFRCYTKTIFHENSTKKTKGFNEWLHPDLVGVYYPFNDYEEETTNLQQSLNVNSVKLFSFEMKKELTLGNLREYRLPKQFCPQYQRHTTQNPLAAKSRQWYLLLQNACYLKCCSQQYCPCRPRQ